MGGVFKPERAVFDESGDARHHGRKRRVEQKRQSVGEGCEDNHRKAWTDVHQGGADDERETGRVAAGGAGRVGGVARFGQGVRDVGRHRYHRE